jgi:hypothetical protein
MIQVQREVRTGATRFWMSTRAASIEGTVSVAGARNPGGEVRLVLPAESVAFFAGAGPGEADSLRVQMPESAAG